MKLFSFLSQKLHCDCSYVTLDFDTTETKNWSRGIHYQIYVHYFCLLESNKTSLIDMKFVSVVIGVIILKT